MNSFRRMVMMSLSLGLFVGLGTGCGPVADDHAQHSEFESSEQSVWACAPGYHYHYVDWSATRITPPGATCGTGKLVYNTDPFCQQDGSNGTSVCGDGYWYVYGYDPRDGYAGWIKIKALSAHD